MTSINARDGMNSQDRSYGISSSDEGELAVQRSIYDLTTLGVGVVGLFILKRIACLQPTVPTYRYLGTYLGT